MDLFMDLFYCFMDLFYCGSNQSLGAMVFPLTQVAPFSPISISSFGMDGGGRRVVRVASAEESKDQVVIFSISKVFCVSLAGQLSSLYLSRRCLYLHSCVRCFIIMILQVLFQKKQQAALGMSRPTPSSVTGEVATGKAAKEA